ncbi:rRNA-processing protein utp21 [Xanthoria parietina]
MTNDPPRGEAAASPAKRLKVAHQSPQPRNSTIFAPFRTIGLVSPTPVPFTSLPLGKTTFQITTSVGHCLHTYDLRRGLRLIFITRPQTPAPITATVAWKERVLAAWGGEGAIQAPGIWVFQRGRKCAELGMPNGSSEPIKELIVFGSWIVGRCLTRIEVWKSANFEHYTTITPLASSGPTRNTLSGGVCNVPTFLNKIIVGKQDGGVDIWNVSTGKLVYTLFPPDLSSGAVTSVQPATALSLVAIARTDGSIVIHDIQTDRVITELRAQSGHNANITSISFRTDGYGAGEDGQESGLMATAGNDGTDVTIWDLHNGGRVVGVLHGAHNPPSSVHGGVSGGISKVEFLPGQDVMVTSGLDNALKTWIFDANSLSTVPRILHSRSGHAAPVTLLDFLPTNSEDADATGKWILSAGRDQSLWGWSIRQDGQSGELSQGGIRKTAKKLGLLGSNLEIDSSSSLDDLKAPKITCFACSLNRDGGMGAAPSAGGIWANVASKKGTHDASDSGMTGWESIVTGHRGDKHARTWFWGRKRAGRWAFETTDGTEVTSVGVSSCGTFALVGSAGGSISMFNLQSGLLRQRFPAPLNPAQAQKLKLEQSDLTRASRNTPRFRPGTGKHRKAVTGLLVDPLNRTVVSCGIEGKIKFWDMHSGVLQDEIDWSRTTAITAARYYMPSDLVAFSCDDLSLRVIDLETKKLVRELWGCLGQINDFCFSNDGRWIIAASMDSVIRVWDLPTAHLISAFQVESPCTALAFSDTGEYLATAHADSVGINLWNNRTLFTHVPTRKIGDEEIMRATLPTPSGERGQGLLSAAFDETEQEFPEEDDVLIDQSPADIDTLSNDLLSLSLIPKARWQTLLHLQTIKARNKPTEPPKAPEKAPFFLPSLTNGRPEPKVVVTNGASRSSADNHTLSHLSRATTSLTQSEFTAHLGTFAHQRQNGDPDPLLTHLSALAPSAADSAIRTLANLDEMTAFVQALTVRLRQRRDYELVQTWMSVFLRCHGDVIVGQDNENEGVKEALRQALRNWRQEQGREGRRLDELVGYCSGVAAWLRSTR